MQARFVMRRRAPSMGIPARCARKTTPPMAQGERIDVYIAAPQKQEKTGRRVRHQCGGLQHSGGGHSRWNREQWKETRPLPKNGAANRREQM